MTGLRLDEPARVAALGATVADRHPVLVILDPLILLHSLDENRPSDMARVMRPVVELAARAEVCVLVVHHTNKPQADRRPARIAQRFRGASTFAGATDANIVLDRDGDRTVRLRAEFRDAEPVELYLAFDPLTLRLSPTLPPENHRKVERGGLLEWIREAGNVTAAEVAVRYGVTKPTARRALEELVTLDMLDSGRDGQVERYFPA